MIASIIDVVISLIYGSIFIIYINNIHRSSNLGKFILFADDTNIYVADKCKNTVYETANKVLEFVYSSKWNLILTHTYFNFYKTFGMTA